MSSCLSRIAVALIQAHVQSWALVKRKRERDIFGFQGVLSLGHVRLICTSAEATCSSAIRSCKGFVKDLGVEAARRAPGMVEVSRLPEKDAEERLHKVLDTYGLGLPIVESALDVGDPELRLPLLRLRDWVDFMLQNNCWHMLTGLRHPDPQREAAILQGFWERYRKTNPSHPIFGMAERGELKLTHTCPVAFHGDEGRGMKKQAFIVTNFHSLLGRGMNPEWRQQGAGMRPKKFLKMKVNFKGSTHCSRLLFGCMPKHWYTSSRAFVFDRFMEEAAAEALHMYTHGVRRKASGETHWAALLAVVGDWPWLQKSGPMDRSFSHVQKRLNVRKEPSGICHLCQAGQRNIPYEQLGTTRPRWKDTMFVQEPFSSPSTFRCLPHEDGKLPALWQYDLFHVWHLGMGKTFCANVAALLSDTYAAGNVDERFQLLTLDYVQWCKDNSCNPWVKKLCKKLFGWPTRGHWPNGIWYKGTLTTSLMRFFEGFYDGRDFEEPMLPVAMEACKAINSCFRILFSSELFLTRSEAQHAAGYGLRFLRRYESLAHMASSRKLSLWTIQPKAHALQHLFIDMDSTLKAGAERVLNPLAWATQPDEDFTGRPSRLARRTRPGKVQVHRIVQRHLKAAYDEWKEMGYVIQTSRSASGA